MKAAELVGLLFLGRDIAHDVHLNTRSYAKHMALGEFYPTVIALADKFAETYNGTHGLIGKIQFQSVKKPGNIVDFLQGQVEDIEQGRFEVCGKEETALQNIIDEIVALYRVTIYKLRFLA